MIFAGEIEGLETPDSLISRTLIDSPFNLTCIADSNITWYYNNIPLCLGPEDIDCFPHSDLSPVNGVLLFSSVTLEQAGWYTCATANEQLGRRETDFLVIVEGQRSIVSKN